MSNAGMRHQNDVRLVSYNFIGGWIVDQFPLHEFLRLCYHMRFNEDAAQYIIYRRRFFLTRALNLSLTNKLRAFCINQSIAQAIQGLI